MLPWAAAGAGAASWRHRDTHDGLARDIIEAQHPPLLPAAAAPAVGAAAARVCRHCDSAVAALAVGGKHDCALAAPPAAALCAKPPAGGVTREPSGSESGSGARRLHCLTLDALTLARGSNAPGRLPCTQTAPSTAAWGHPAAGCWPLQLQASGGGGAPAAASAALAHWPLRVASRAVLSVYSAPGCRAPRSRP